MWLMLILLPGSPGYCQGGDLRHNDPYVTAIYPSGDSLPSNILRFYVRFSEPMRETGSLSHVRVEGPEGGAMSNVFFDNNEELWNSDRTMLTLLVDPGRVKTGLRANEQLGRSFVPGVRYCLTINGGMLSMQGDTISRPFSKSFVVSPPDTTALSFARWKIEAPAAHSSGALRVRFDRSMDYACAGAMIVIQEPDGGRVKGIRILKQREEVWEFVPARRWRKSTYRLLISSRLEDVAGNNFFAPFDHRKGKERSGPVGETIVYTFSTIIKIQQHAGLKRAGQTVLFHYSERPEPGRCR